MARTLSNTALNELMAQESTDTFHELIQIDYPTLTSPIRVTNNGEDVLSNGNTYTSCPFTIEAPADEDNFITELRLSIENVSRTLIPIIRETEGTPTCSYKIVLDSDKNTEEINLDNFELQDVDYDAFLVTAKFGEESFLTESYPGNIFSPAIWKGLG